MVVAVQSAIQTQSMHQVQVVDCNPPLNKQGPLSVLTRMEDSRWIRCPALHQVMVIPSQSLYTLGNKRREYVYKIEWKWIMLPWRSFFCTKGETVESTTTWSDDVLVWWNSEEKKKRVSSLWALGHFASSSECVSHNLKDCSFNGFQVDRGRGKLCGIGLTRRSG